MPPAYHTDNPAMPWSRWKPFPDPSKGGVLTAPFGPGVYEVRDRRTGRPICFGISSHVAKRMTSLLPRPHGSGVRNNSRKRRYILNNLRHIEYRTLSCRSRTEAVQIERDLKHCGKNWLYNT